MAELVLSQAYARVKNYRRLLGVWKTFLEKDPDNLEYWKNVATIYLELNEKANAIKTLEDAIAHDPSFKEQGEQFIAEIQGN